MNGLLGSTISACAIRPSIAPGFLYLRSCQNIHNVQYVNDVIVGLVVEYAGELAAGWASMDSPCLKSNQASLSLATARAREVATLVASLLCVMGGVHLVQELFRDTTPIWLLSSRKETPQGRLCVPNSGGVRHGISVDFVRGNCMGCCGETDIMGIL